ncbi:HD domain-containing protein [Rossellomorea vietnamensis]|uniref:bis(5'-nucleosyl)-tetraphosphatase (symmetrical) n=1 Tax=Rossellomorea vietnamensis TaxID=218284 RepID=A0A5D4KDH2_9BACI|nr:bis(5'-nucleosyl)-tetraphosphatase (symmetrical) YqeK [Rossellomorea vietnamensis]TYR75447.1 HD domain-containing protein [Rossellomorea vietnamensis]
MDRDKALNLVRAQLTEHRYQHTLGVMETAIELAERYNADRDKAEMAAIFHDYAKFRPKEEMKEIIETEEMDKRLLEYNAELWHAPVGAYLVRKEAGVEDEEILDAIRFHTSGRPGMTNLEKVIYLADYIEPGRHFPGVDEVRELAKDNLEEALIVSIRNSITFLMKKNQAVFPETFYTFNELVLKNRS